MLVFLANAHGVVMPKYEYKCECSDTIHEVERAITAPEEEYPCPQCNVIMKRVYSSFGINLKGSGWYSKGG
jgi:putative FmdB family regulatory protein